MPTTTQTAPAENPGKASTRHLLVDARFAGLLAEDFGLDRDTVLRALEGEPQRRGIALCEWASTKGDPAGALLAWSRKHHKGQHRRCVRGQGLPTERPDRRHGRPSPNSPAPGRGSDTSSRVAVDSLRGVQVDGDALDAIAAKLGV